MTSEYKQWMDFMKSRRGKWTMDQIHNGANGRDFLAFAPRPEDPTAGVYVRVAPCGMVQAGSYEGALPHIGEAMFTTRWAGKMGEDGAAATKAVIERLGLRFLLDVIDG